MTKSFRLETYVMYSGYLQRSLSLFQFWGYLFDFLWPVHSYAWHAPAWRQVSDSWIFEISPDGEEREAAWPSG